MCRWISHVCPWFNGCIFLSDGCVDLFWSNWTSTRAPWQNCWPLLYVIVYTSISTNVLFLHVALMFFSCRLLFIKPAATSSLTLPIPSSRIVAGQTYRAYTVYFVHGSQRDTLVMDSAMSVTLCSSSSSSTTSTR